MAVELYHAAKLVTMLAETCAVLSVVVGSISGFTQYDSLAITFGDTTIMGIDVRDPFVIKACLVDLACTASMSCEGIGLVRRPLSSLSRHSRVSRRPGLEKPTYILAGSNSAGAGGMEKLMSIEDMTLADHYINNPAINRELKQIFLELVVDICYVQ